MESRLNKLPGLWGARVFRPLRNITVDAPKRRPYIFSPQIPCLGDQNFHLKVIWRT
jgi:hypothetical protein